MRVTLSCLLLAALMLGMPAALAAAPPVFDTAREAFDYVGENTIEDGDLAIDSTAPLQVRVLVQTVPGDVPAWIQHLGEHAAVMAVFTAFIFTDSVDSIEVSAYAKPLKPEFATVVDPTRPLVTIRATRDQAQDVARNLMGVSDLSALTGPSPYLDTQWVFAPVLSRAFYNDQGSPTRDEVLRMFLVHR